MKHEALLIMQAHDHDDGVRSRRSLDHAISSRIDLEHVILIIYLPARRKTRALTVDSIL
jgi:hypothetical protein